MTDQTAVLVLAGGLGRRLGGRDKAGVVLGGMTLLGRVLARLGPQGAPLLINANGDPARHAGWGIPIVPDDVPDHPGPLAGILAGLDWVAAHRPDIPDLVSVSVDTPFLPADLIAGLRRARAKPGASLSCAVSAGRRHPVVALWTTALRHDLRHALVERGERSVGAFLSANALAEASWPTEPYDPFFNINRPADIVAAEAVLAMNSSA